MYPNGLPEVFSRSVNAGVAAGNKQYIFGRGRFKSVDPAEVRAEVRLTNNRLIFRSTVPLPSGRQVDPYYVWNKIVVAYTESKLTKEYDKLVAISAVAKRIRLMTQDDYLAGLVSSSNATDSSLLRFLSLPKSFP